MPGRSSGLFGVGRFRAIVIPCVTSVLQLDILLVRHRRFSFEADKYHGVYGAA